MAEKFWPEEGGSQATAGEIPNPGCPAESRDKKRVSAVPEKTSSNTTGIPDPGYKAGSSGKEAPRAP